MKRLPEHEPYPAELWEETDAPAWSAERVWQQIEAQQAPTRPKAWWLLWGFLLAFALGGLLWLSAGEVTTSVGVERDNEGKASLQELPSGRIEGRSLKVPEELPEKIMPARSPSQLEVPHPMPPASTTAPQDTVSSQLGIPIAQERSPVVAPVLPLAKPLELLPEPVATLPADIRSGTKLKLKVPEITAAEARQGAFAKRLWQQYKRLNIEGEIDWVELGVQPNGDGTFSILPPASKTTSKPN